MLPLLLAAGCRGIVDRTDRDVAAVIAARQRAALGQQAAAPVPVDDELLGAPPRAAYAKNPNPRLGEIPAEFEAAPGEAVPPPTSAPAASQPTTGATAAAAWPLTTAPAASAPATSGSGRRFALTDALAFAQQHRRALESAKEQLYLAALSLTLERHLWSPIFASNLRTVYGNFGEIRDFDQAMRFVADLSVAQRLPFGGEFTAAAVSTLIRDVKQTITSSEGSSIELGLKVPFLRGAGHVAQEQLILLERELTYAVRVFERFRRQQLVDVASDYFDLLRTKQSVRDSEQSLRSKGRIFERAREYEARGFGRADETERAQMNLLTAQNSLEVSRESFRAQADQFKILIGMPVDEPLDMEDLEDIETIEAEIERGGYPLLHRPAAVEDEPRALQVAIENRLDLLNRQDRIDDARRGVAIAQNALLPDLELNSSVAWETDPAHFRLGDFSFDRTTWRSELVLGLPLERTAERNRYRTALIDVRQAQRDYQDALEGIRAEVRSAVNQIRLAERTLEIQRRNLDAAARRLDYTNYRYYEVGDIEVRELLDAEDEAISARNAYNLAKTGRWNQLLRFRLATETLRIEEDGTQPPAADLASE